MQKIFTLVLFTFSATFATAQTVQWASQVKEFSSQLSASHCSATQVLGTPNVLPNFGVSSDAWVPLNKRNEFITVSFDTAIRIQQVAIGESDNPSAVKKVTAYEASGKAHELITLSPVRVNLKGRMLNLFFPMTEYPVKSIRVDLDGSHLSGHFALDAIAISSSPMPVKAHVNVNPLLRDDLTVLALGATINSTYPELHPVLSSDQQRLYFNRVQHPQNNKGERDRSDIWFSELNPEKAWGEAQNLSAFNSRYADEVIYASASRTLVSKDHSVNGMKNTSVFASNAKATALDEEPIMELRSYSREHNFFIVSETIMFVSMEGEDSYGGQDLYVSYKKGNAWGDYINLGPTINTASDEVSPYVSADGRLLFFSSAGHGGFGNMDVYIAHRGETDSWNEWGAPENMGNRINTTADELYFTMPEGAPSAYFCRTVDGTSNTDIFQVPQPLFRTPSVNVLVKLVDGKSFHALGGLILVTDEITQKTTTLNLDSTGTTFTAVNGHRYQLQAQKEGYSAAVYTIDLNYSEHESEKFEVVLMPEEKVMVKEPLVLSHTLHYSTNIAALDTESLQALQDIVNQCADGTCTLTVTGHSDAVGDKTFNENLSRARAEWVRDYLISKSVKAETIHTLWSGSSEPLGDNSTEDGRKLNRRVEVKMEKAQ